MEGITGPGTIDQLVADAEVHGHETNIRLIRDWTQAGLLGKATAHSRRSTPRNNATSS
jgi:hypothetical protein